MYLHFTIRISVGAVEDGDQGVFLRDIVHLKMVLMRKGEAHGKIKKDWNALKRNNACREIEQMVTAKRKNNEMAMIFVVLETLMGAVPFREGEKGVCVVAGASCHMHVSVCRVFRSVHVSMPLFFGPPNGTPYVEACGKPGFKGRFKGELEEEYAVWAEENIMRQNQEKRARTATISQKGYELGCGGFCGDYE